MPRHSGSATRQQGLDALRGIAMLWMTAFHFCFDLNHFGYLHQNFHADLFWTGQRTVIVSLFLLCAGAGQAVAVAQGQSWGRFWRRWAQVTLCALAVTAASWLMYPQTFIYFGVLHGLAVMLIVVRLTAGWGGWLWALGALAIASKWIATYAMAAWSAGGFYTEFLNGRALNWLGWVTRLPMTEDFVPVFPWLGVMWWGMALAQWLLRRHPDALASGLPLPRRATAGLATLGRWSLSYYMVHQPVLIGALTALAWLKH